MTTVENGSGSDFAGVAVAAFIVLVIAMAAWGDFRRRRNLAASSAVELNREFPNNHHILGVGYYHAASKRWYPHPWNEYREDRGYYWNGEWNQTPDQRMVAKSTPDATEVERVNAEWRKADPELAGKFWATVDREGFGTAIRRSEGS